MYSAISSFEQYAPTRIIPSSEPEELVTIEDILIRALMPGTVEKLSGIRQRRWSDTDEYSSTLAAKPVAGCDPDDVAQVEAIIFASASRDMVEPATGSILADTLGLNVPSFDVSNACNSWLNGVQIADSFIRSGMYHEPPRPKGRGFQVGTEP